MSVEEQCPYAEFWSTKFEFLEKRVTYLEGKVRGQQAMIEELQTKSASQENIIHELQSELEQARNQEDDSGEEEVEESEAARSQEEQSSEEEVEESQSQSEAEAEVIDISSDSDTEQAESIDNEQLIIAENHGARCHKKLQRLETTCENSAKVEIDTTSELYQRKSKYAHPNQKAKNVGKSSVKSKGNGGKSHICEFCLKTCRSYSFLNWHLWHHMISSTRYTPRVRAHKCTTCSKAFTTETSFKLHIRVHKGEKLFSCPVCSKTFLYKQVCNSHMLIHTGKLN